MRWPRSLQGRLALGAGIGLTALWIGAAIATSTILRHEVDEVFDSALAETARRVLPLAVREVSDLDDGDGIEEIEDIRPYDDIFTYVVRDGRGRTLLQSFGADAANFPQFEEIGFADTATHRLFFDSALGGQVTIAIAEPAEHRAKIVREAQLGLALPLLFLIPLSLGGVVLLMRLSLRPVIRYRNALASRGAGDLSPVDDHDLPTEIRPVAKTLNRLLRRLRRAFDAERSFASNAAHELRTPVAAALAQAQRLMVETSDHDARKRASDIESSLKRLNRMSEKLIQLARAEGGRLRTGTPRDIRPVLQMVAGDFDRSVHAGLIEIDLPSKPVMADVDPDALAILLRNLVENALKHGSPAAPVEVRLGTDRVLRVINDGPVIPPDELKQLTSRFVRGATRGDGSGLGLSIVGAIVEGTQGTLRLNSPAAGRPTGFEAVVSLA